MYSRATISIGCGSEEMVSTAIASINTFILVSLPFMANWTMSCVLDTCFPPPKSWIPMSSCLIVFNFNLYLNLLVTYVLWLPPLNKSLQLALVLSFLALWIFALVVSKSTTFSLLNWLKDACVTIFSLSEFASFSPLGSQILVGARHYTKNNFFCFYDYLFCDSFSFLFLEGVLHYSLASISFPNASNISVIQWNLSKTDTP